MILSTIYFIMLILLMDFFNGILGNPLAKKLKRAFIVISLFTVLSFIVSFLCSFNRIAEWFLFCIEMLTVLTVSCLKKIISKFMQYENLDFDKKELFGGQKILLIVPHEDDDINLLGGAIEEYIKYSSSVSVVFATNGDGDIKKQPKDIGYTRLKEAISALSFLGVREQNIYFLGYGDSWNADGAHIYNAQKDKIIHSMAGRTETYGLTEHNAYQEGKAYTYNNYFNDLKQIILDISADVIYCVDYDTHNDHRALSMFFEKAMGEILKENDYRPKVYKGYAYRTAWNAPKDYYSSLNLVSTVDCKADNDVLLYDWNERFRLPVDSKSLSRCVSYSKLYRALRLHKSQRAFLNAEMVINGDKVFWERRTDSLCTNAEIMVSSGEGSKLNDFMLLDCDDLISNGNHPFDGVWHPDENDCQRCATISWKKPIFVNQIVLYDNPSPEDNVLDATLILSNGQQIQTGSLKPFGQGTVFEINKELSYFTVVLDKYEGNNYGLCEIEAFSKPHEIERPFIKITDDANNFVYDFITSVDETQEFKIYNYSGEESPNYQVICSNKKCKLLFDDEKISLTCPKGSKTRLTVSTSDGALSDTVVVRNPGTISRWIYSLCCRSIYLHKTYAHQIFINLIKMIGFKNEC